MQATKRHVAPLTPIVVGNLITTIGVRDIDLDHNEVGRVVERKGFHVLIDQRCLDVRIKVGGQCGKSERWKE